MSGRKIKRSASAKSRKPKVVVIEQVRARRGATGKKSRGGKRKQRSTAGVESGGINRISFASAPVNVGAKYGPSFVRGRAGNVQSNADFDARDGSERVQFCDTLTTQVQAGSGTPANGFGGAFTYQVNLAPSGISPRLIQYEEMYQYYAIRSLLIEYCPLISTSTSVGFNIGIMQNVDSSPAVGVPTAQDVNELSPSMAGPVYLPNSMRFEHKGVRLWSTTSDGVSDQLSYDQGVIQCILDGSPVAATVYGKLRISGTVDFYKSISPFTTNPAVMIGNRVRYRLDNAQRQQVFDAYLHGMAKVAQRFNLVLKPALLDLTEDEKLLQLSDAEKVKLLEKQFAALNARVSRLGCSTPETPHTHVEADDEMVVNNHLSDSVHIPRSVASQMLSFMGKTSNK